MTDASMHVATVNLRPTPTATDYSGAASDPGIRGNEASTTDRKTFADALESAGQRSGEESDRSETSAAKENKSNQKASSGSDETRTRRTRTKRSSDSKGVSAKNKPVMKDLLAASRLESRQVEDDETISTDTSESVVSHDQQEAFSKTALQSGIVDPGFSTAQQAGIRKNNASETKPKANGNLGKVSTNPTEKQENTAPNLSSRSGKVEVIDRREATEATDKVDSELTSRSRGTASDTRQKVSTEVNSESPRSFSLAVAETDIELSPSADKAGSVKNAAAQLARKLDGQAGSDIVRQVKVVLTKADAGEVQINLRPDNLGRVRVRIQMEDNKLTGRIFVETAAAREAFRNALDGLQTRLVESGFGSADLELAWDDSASNFADGREQSNGKSADTGHAAREFENMVSTTVIDEIADGRVDLVV